MEDVSGSEPPKRKIGTLSLSVKRQSVTTRTIEAPAAGSCYIGEQSRPPRVEPELEHAPRVRELYWCRLPEDAELPEMWKIRPVIVVSLQNTLRGAVTVIPTSTEEQADNEWAELLETSIDDKVSYAICDQVLTLAVSRLERPKVRAPKITQAEIDRIASKMQKRLPQSLYHKSLVAEANTPRCECCKNDGDAK